MNSASAIRSQIESVLSRKVPAALSPRLRPEPERISCGIDVLDAMLHGGVSVGALTEIVGAESSGRTTFAMAVLASHALRESVCAWIDVNDAFDPESAAAGGIDLARLLWVRCRRRPSSSSPALPQPITGGAILTSHAPVAVPVRGGGSPHPRSEGRDMPQAISTMLQPSSVVPLTRRQKKSIGTPGMPNRPLGPHQREEQVPSDRQPARRGQQVMSAPRVPVSIGVRQEPLQVSPMKTRTPPAKSWDALDQALRTTDLLLQGGGFSVIVLDLASLPAEMVWRIPLATWFRIRAACAHSRVSVLLLTQHPCARSSAELVVRMAAGSMHSGGTVMTGIGFRAEKERQRFQPQQANVVSIRKPPQSERGDTAHNPAQWTGTAAWANPR